MDYKISVIVPIYNVEKYLPEAMDSLKRQTIGFNNIEVILVDDNSTDESKNIADQFASENSNVISIHLSSSSGAAGKPRNVGIKNASAEYIMFLDPDDYYTDNACDLLYQKISEKNIDFAFASYRTISEDGSIVLENNVLPKGFPDEIDSKSIEENQQLLELSPSIWTKIYKKSFIEKNNIEFPEKIVSQDFVFNIHAMLSANGIYFFNDIVYNYRIRNKESKSISYVLDEKYFYGINKSQLLAYELFKRFNKEYLFSIILAKYLDFNIKNIFFSQLISNSQKKDIINYMYWFFEQCFEKEIKPKDKLNEKMYALIFEKKYNEALDLYNHIYPLVLEYEEWAVKQEEGKKWLENQLERLESDLNSKENIIIGLKQYNNELIEGNKWLEGQLSDYKENFSMQINVIEDMKKWISDLEEGKSWIENQLENYKKEVENQNIIIDDLKMWNQQLIEAKEYLEKELSDK
ncbi:glycosyltransferase family 2 protein [Paenibacillus brasilensis]|uniref:Glycosyltransferase involved in cell wall biosynthesis n=1 Tax=Paenibacillus brasilensis TaxID=128574 RepID=A0ABU0KTN4_9BACL|nr:glycosyltransferase [Paenibacillus brasilensis]MDQ0492735.1 glycosyltransferase involved in cell wall biosynthesis [Paenibacillus brasilensis]